MQVKEVVEAVFLPRSPFKSLPESYTLFGAICWGIRVLYGESELLNMLERFKGNPPFLISSPFFIKSEGRHFPKPVLPNMWEESLDPSEYSKRKNFKKVNFIPERTFREILEGRISSNRELADKLKDAKAEFYEVSITAHASINRITWTTTEGSLYNEEAYYFGSRFGVFIAIYDESFKEMIEASLSFVQLGGNRSTGMGSYEVVFEEAPYWVREHLTPENSLKFISLSPHFYDEVFDLNKSFYDVKPVSGVVDNYYFTPVKAILKERVMYFWAGSSMYVRSQRDFYGGMKGVARDNDRNVSIWQYGYAFPLYVRVGT